jgi:hypothetical protein
MRDALQGGLDFAAVRPALVAGRASQLGLISSVLDA